MTSFSNGESVDINPATGQLTGAVPNTDLSQFGEIMTKARDAQKQWADLSFKQRAQYVLKMRDYIIQNADELAKVVSESNGKTRMDAMSAEIVPCAAACDWYAKKTKKVLKPKLRPLGSVMFFHKLTKMEHVPLGVVGIISPWNYPLSIPFGEVVMGLMAGNAIVLKVAEATTMVGQAIQKIVDSAGLPSDVFTMVYGRGSEVSNAMLQGGINKLFFTGSVPAGKSIMAAAAQTLTPLSLELGGNDPAIVLDDADVERTSNGLIWAAYQNAGQSCGGAERLYVQEGIYDELMSAMRAKVKALRYGVPSDEHLVDVGAMTTEKQLDLVKQHIEQAVNAGGEITAEGKLVGMIENGFFHPPVLIENCTQDMQAMQEETFGPTLNVMKFKTVGEAIALANDSNLALTSSIWTKDVKKGKKLALALESGVTTINDHLFTHGMSETPWGGWKESGIGRTHGYEGLLEMTNEKTINWDWINAKRNLWWHPHDKTTYEAMKQAMDFAFPSGFGVWVKSSTGLTVTMLKKMFGAWKP